MQFQDQETIRFINKNLIEYNHVNADGSICAHTFHSPDLKKKIQLDVNSLKHWIKRYYINKENDKHYEHIIISDKEFNNEKTVFLFTDVVHKFTKHQYGYFEYSFLSKGKSRDISLSTNIVQCFNLQNKKIWCDWSTIYKGFEKAQGIFVFIEDPPVNLKRFAVANWKQLEAFLSMSFLTFMCQISKKFQGSQVKPSLLPLLIGYKIDDIKIHWQTVLIETNKFPIFCQKILGTNKNTGICSNYEIVWAKSSNCSYQYYFGRGSLHSRFTERRILLIGIGAIGSIVATTLVRGGSKSISIVDHDIKEPENVCRSEYSFISGMNGKVNELSNKIVEISPFVEVNVSEILLDFAKLSLNEAKEMAVLKDYLEKFDIIIDCSADYEVGYILDNLNIDSELISLSITNHAKELVCTVSPNLYRWKIDILNKLNQENEDLYNPTGCSSPTFKASYNDVANLVHYAVKQINYCYINELPLRNFYLSSTFEGGLTIKLNQF
jgi:hypothetical protein